MRFIIVDPKDDGPNYQGVFGPMDAGNVYLTAYAQYPDNKHPTYLAIGESIHGVIFRLGNEKGTYSVRRIA